MACFFVDISFFNTIYPHGLLVSDVTLLFGVFSYKYVTYCYFFDVNN